MTMNQGLTDLVEQIDRMIETVATAPGLDDAELRQILRFLTQVIQVVEQAFQDVLTLLIEIKYLENSDLGSTKMTELRKQIDLLTARSFYRDAAEICSRLKHLRQNFDQFVRPVINNLPQISGWGGVLGLIEEREGRIIMLIENTANHMSRMLDTVDGSTLMEAKAAASQNAEELRLLLSELHELNGKILGFSGKTGFLELTRNRNELQREVQIMIDKRDQSITHGPKVQLGDSNVFHGDFAIATTIQDSFNQIAQSSANDDLKQKLELLCSQVQDLTKMLPAEKQKEMAQDLSSFVAEATKETPRRKWYELNAEGLIEAAKACAGLASPVIATVKEVLALLSTTA
ncbi:hypothetical protein [Nitrosomonas sp. Nm166]|uniref:hypothetical protein n=1 Tax=Nitrosomonas sp. Nm166 TaxID=1881054 RepID=UPI0008EB7874|nr:hypothetical protein [Nitrosomonas sp. Nm166]SFF08576.1 hypothetical protein SAMN05428977_104815 [Nitrosomonas sp. Nm166]